jgi:hypothetical protein
MDDSPIAARHGRMTAHPRLFGIARTVNQSLLSYAQED